jgi:hypothetical protein
MLTLMKIFINILITLVLSITLISCDTNTKTNEPETVNNILPYNLRIKEFSYNEHDYILFLYIRSNFEIIHSPDCKKCNK